MATRVASEACTRLLRSERDAEGRRRARAHPNRRLYVRLVADQPNVGVFGEYAEHSLVGAGGGVEFDARFLEQIAPVGANDEALAAGGVGNAEETGFPQVGGASDGARNAADGPVRQAAGAGATLAGVRTRTIEEARTATAKEWWVTARERYTAS